MPHFLYLFQDAFIQKNGQIIFQNFNWTIKQGENWVILGQSGSGKTTLIEALLGKCLVNGDFKKNVPTSDIVQVPRDFAGHWAVKAAMQYYQQRFNGFDADLAPTVRAFLTDQVKPIGTINALSVSLPPNTISDITLLQTCQLLRVEHLLERHLTALSNGETRRVLLTYSLLKKANILLLDDPFIGLDVASRQQLHEVLNQIMASGITVIMVSSQREIPTNITHILDLDLLHSPRYISSQTGQVVGEDTDHGTDIENKVHLFDYQPIVNFKIAIEMRNVNIKYGSVKILENINWTVKAGEKWAILGPNGSGKSTLLSLVTADNPQGYANDYDLFDRKRGTGESIWDIKRQIGFVSPELHSYFPRNYTCFEVVASGLFERLGVTFTVAETEKTQTQQVLQLLQLKELSQKNFGQISAGQQRFVLLARALVKNPPLLILDEPCQGLDQNQSELFRSIIQRLCANSSRTLIYVTHYTDEIPDCVTHTLRLGV
jgi:molybdate transport system ATP-binding protein